MRRLIVILAVLGLFASACNGKPELSDPADIMVQSTTAMAGADSFRVEMTADGLYKSDTMTLDFSGATLVIDIDMKNSRALMSFSMPTLLGLNGEVRMTDDATYVRTSMTGEQWQKSARDSDLGDLSQAFDPDDMRAKIQSSAEAGSVTFKKGTDVACGASTCYTVEMRVAGLGGLLDGSFLDSQMFGSLPGGSYDFNSNPLPTATPTADTGDKDLSFMMLVDKNDLLLRQFSFEMPGQTSSGDASPMTFTFDFSRYGEEVLVETPSADEINELGAPFSL